MNGTKNPSGAPSLYAANFQAITWAQQNAGYLDAVGTPNKTLEAAFQKADSELGNFIKFLNSTGKLDSTLLMVGSKQGQGPINPKTEYLIDPSLVTGAVSVNITYFNGEDGGIMFLENPSDAQKAKQELLSNKTLGISYVLAGDQVSISRLFSRVLLTLPFRSPRPASARHSWTHACRTSSLAPTQLRSGTRASSL